MRAVSAAWSRSIAGSYPAVFRATVCDTYQTTTTPTGTRVLILGGGVYLDGSAQIRSTLDLTTDGTDMWPRLVGDPLAPYGNEVYVERGIRFSDALIEWVGLGYHRVQDLDQAEPDGPIRVTGLDRMAGIIDARLTKPRQFAASTTLGSVMASLVQEVYPAAVITWDDATNAVTLTRAAICEEDRFAFLDDLVRAHSKIWYWDHTGTLVIKTAPSTTSPVGEVVAGPNGLLMGLGRRLTRERVYNAVVASGEATDTYGPATATAFDNNPLSPTYYSGRFGPVPRFFTSPFIYTQAQAQAVAEATLRRSLGLPYQLDLSLSPNPALEPWDAVTVRATGHAGLETHVLEKLTIPLVPDEPMMAATREQTTVLIGQA